jgi:hypothetical protein
LKKVLIYLTLGRSSLKIWVFVCEITDGSFWGWMICLPAMHQWTQGAMCYDWAEKCCCGVLEYDHDHPGLLCPVTRWFWLDVRGWWWRNKRLSERWWMSLWNPVWRLPIKKDCS